MSFDTLTPPRTSREKRHLGSLPVLNIAAGFGRGTFDEIESEYMRLTGTDRCPPIARAVYDGLLEKVICYRLTSKAHKLLDKEEEK